MVQCLCILWGRCLCGRGRGGALPLHIPLSLRVIVKIEAPDLHVAAPDPGGRKPSTRAKRKRLTVPSDSDGSSGASDSSADEADAAAEGHVCAFCRINTRDPEAVRRGLDMIRKKDPSAKRLPRDGVELEALLGKLHGPFSAPRSALVPGEAFEPREFVFDFH